MHCNGLSEQNLLVFISRLQQTENYDNISHLVKSYF